MRKKRSFVPRSAMQDNVLSLVSIVGILLLTLSVVALILWFLYRTELFSLPAELRSFLEPEENVTEADNDAPSAYDILREDFVPDPSVPVYRFSGDFSVLRTLLAASEPESSYYTETQTVLSAGSSRSISTVCLWKSGEQYRIERVTGGNVTERTVCDGTRIRYEDLRSGSARIFPLSDDFFAEALAGIPSAASFHRIPDEQIESASYAEIDGGIVYYVRFRHSDSGFREEYWISPASELVIRCRTYSGPIDAETTSVVFSGDMKEFRPLTEKERSTAFVIDD